MSKKLKLSFSTPLPPSFELNYNICARIPFTGCFFFFKCFKWSEAVAVHQLLFMWKISQVCNTLVIASVYFPSWTNLGVSFWTSYDHLRRLCHKNINLVSMKYYKKLLSSRKWWNKVVAVYSTFIQIFLKFDIF